MVSIGNGPRSALVFAGPLSPEPISTSRLVNAQLGAILSAAKS
jgi:hypothetical protein